MSNWTPVMYRGDGAWIGIMPDGRIGVGVESEGRAALTGSGFVPMWPYMERDLSESLTEFSDSWEQLGQGDISTPERLIELTVESAWKSGRSYWMQVAAPWVIEMSHRKDFNQDVVRKILRQMQNSEVLPVEVREQARRASE